ncbi:hypothetical protein ABFY62_31355 [Pseudomonas aeruginosa]|uniref:hypothetical protein n=1 Tax=Pseudomonas aeruginosa TaxID=287 RepID=UPI003D2879A2
MATGCPVAIAFDAGNLLPVGKAMQTEYPSRPLIFCGDDDWKTTRQDGSPWNPGAQAAENAATILGASSYSLASAASGRRAGTDFNDLHCAEGAGGCPRPGHGGGPARRRKGAGVTACCGSRAAGWRRTW